MALKQKLILGLAEPDCDPDVAGCPIASHCLTRAQCRSGQPKQRSGGERQRLNIARALAAEPKLIVCDKITSALDAVAQAILDLLRDLQDRLDAGYLFISRDISTIARIADIIAVMQNGDIVELGQTEDVLTLPERGSV